MDQTLIRQIVEAALLAAPQPLTLAQLAGLFPEDEPAPNGSLQQALDELREACADRGVELVEVASGFRFQVKADVHPWVARLWTERQAKYTRATLETLALIAYRQPITRGEIEQIRGVAVSSNIIQALEEREWIRVVGHRDVPGKPALFGTTKGFLDYFGLKRLDELPPLSELRDLGELEPQLPLDRDGQPAGRLAAGAATPDAELDGDAANDDTPPLAGDDESQDNSPDGGHAPTTDTVADTESKAPLPPRDDDAGMTAPDGEPDTAPGERAAPQNETENNAVAKTTVAVDQADSEPEADLETVGRSKTDE